MTEHRIFFMKHLSVCLWGLLTAILLVGLTACGNEKQESDAVEKDGAAAESFTFFDLGNNSVYSDDIRRSLKKKLGNDAISRRNMINLELNYPGFLKQYFPELEELNRRLNSNIGERVDHHTTRLMYRYARKRNVPFEYVEILFSSYSKHPLLLNIRFKKDALGTVDRLKAKYGAAEEIIWGRESGRTLYWKKHQDYLFVSLVPDQFGDTEYRVAIYFVANLRELIQTELARQQQFNDEQSESGKSAF